MQIKCKFNVKHVQGVLGQSPEPETHDKVPDNNPDQIGIGNVGFSGERKTGVPGEKRLGAEKTTNNKLNPHMTPGTGIEPGTHWWEASALTTAPSSRISD